MSLGSGYLSSQALASRLCWNGDMRSGLGRDREDATCIGAWQLMVVCSHVFAAEFTPQP